ncbi:hypothetical protein [Kineosporia sp. NBRC 101677]|uniref:hypothetical protein n=1 Tax=Kineosporia sp. NBRC 101677 TaxID=3032197 RepID=UPI0025546611|nr:hypothetical protein [Kineosporia sp. NBRC 101677]
MFIPAEETRWTIADAVTLTRPSRELPLIPEKAGDAGTERVVSAGMPTQAGWFLDSPPVAVEELPAAPDTHFVVHLPIARGGFRVSGRPVSVRMLAQAIRCRPDWGRRPVALVCDGVVTAEALAPLLSSLASALGVTVAGSPGPVLLGPRLLLAQEGFLARRPGSSVSLELGRTLPALGYRIRSGLTLPGPDELTDLPIATTAGADAPQLPAGALQLLAGDPPVASELAALIAVEGGPVLSSVQVSEESPVPAGSGTRRWGPSLHSVPSQEKNLVDAVPAMSVAATTSVKDRDIAQADEQAAVARTPALEFEAIQKVTCLSAASTDPPAVARRAVATWTRVDDRVQERDPHHLRSLLGWHYEAHARAVAGVLALQPGLRSAGAGADLMVGLVAVQAHLEFTGPLVDALLRGEEPVKDDALAGIDATGANLLARCTSAGLRRLPVVVGPVYRAGNSLEAALESYQSGDHLVEPGFAEARLNPIPTSGSTVEYLIWSSTARRTDRVSGQGQEDTARVLFAPATRFVVLDTIRKADGRLSVMLRELPTTPHTSAARQDVEQELDERTRERLREWGKPSQAASRPGPPVPRQWRYPIGIRSDGAVYEPMNVR